jgi:hypothetical protein
MMALIPKIWFSFSMAQRYKKTTSENWWFYSETKEINFSCLF